MSINLPVGRWCERVDESGDMLGEEGAELDKSMDSLLTLFFESELKKSRTNGFWETVDVRLIRRLA